MGISHPNKGPLVFNYIRRYQHFRDSAFSGTQLGFRCEGKHLSNSHIGAPQSEMKTIRRQAIFHYDSRDARVMAYIHDDVIKWKHFPRYWPFVRGIHRSRVNSLHKGQ